MKWIKLGRYTYPEGVFENTDFEITARIWYIIWPSFRTRLSMRITGGANREVNATTRFFIGTWKYTFKMEGINEPTTYELRVGYYNGDSFMCRVHRRVIVGQKTINAGGAKDGRRSDK